MACADQVFTISILSLKKKIFFFLFCKLVDLPKIYRRVAFPYIPLLLLPISKNPRQVKRKEPTHYLEMVWQKKEKKKDNNRLYIFNYHLYKAAQKHSDTCNISRMYKETQLVQHFSPTSLSILNIFKKLFAGKNPEAEEKGSGKGVKKRK